jgi:hypothetical protein
MQVPRSCWHDGPRNGPGRQWPVPGGPTRPTAGRLGPPGTASGRRVARTAGGATMAGAGHPKDGRPSSRINTRHTAAGWVRDSADPVPLPAASSATIAGPAMRCPWSSTAPRLSASRFAACFRDSQDLPLTTRSDRKRQERSREDNERQAGSDTKRVYRGSDKEPGADANGFIGAGWWSRTGGPP